jgi:hypothetical protein
MMRKLASSSRRSSSSSAHTKRIFRRVWYRERTKRLSKRRKAVGETSTDGLSKFECARVVVNFRQVLFFLKTLFHFLNRFLKKVSYVNIYYITFKLGCYYYSFSNIPFITRKILPLTSNNSIVHGYDNFWLVSRLCYITEFDSSLNVL